MWAATGKRRGSARTRYSDRRGVEGARKLREVRLKSVVDHKREGPLLEVEVTAGVIAMAGQWVGEPRVLQAVDSKEEVAGEWRALLARVEVGGCSFE